MIGHKNENKFLQIGYHNRKNINNTYKVVFVM